MMPSRKSCSELGCNKLAATGGICVAHGGGKTCQFEGCKKGYQRGGFCRKHGGGSRCTMPFCRKVDAGRGLCRSHGGGKRCKKPECTKADVGGGFCTAHGGGTRCRFPSCDKNSQGGGFCRAHGGGRRCSEPNCTKMGKGASGKCPEHGGPALCRAPNCRKMARGTLGFCNDHGDEDVSCSDDSMLEPTRLRPRAMSLLAPDPSSSPPHPPLPLPEPAVTFVYRRLLVQALLQGPWTESRVHGILRGETNVRSVHVLGYRHSALPPKHPKTSVCFVVRGTMTSLELKTTFDALQMQCMVLEESAVDDVDVLVETVLDVNGMMCMANCGNTVLRSMRNCALVEQAHLDFEAAQVIVTSRNASAHALISCLQAVGFEANLVAMQPLPTQRRFHLHLASKRSVTAELCRTLETVLGHVEGVERILHVGPRDTPMSSSHDLVVTGFFDTHEVTLVASSTLGVQLIPSDQSLASTNEDGMWSPATYSQDRPGQSIPMLPAPLQTSHDCTLACTENGCIKYRTTMAHTAALAVGWAVPGCGMAFGFECNCGDACKCEGCPTHNPLPPSSSLHA
ncbi:Aste57867_24222 [Aphanomyces stellatus]|uniref:Aste57867_24222 protein n=1 Tax=Aphanomyces stellatus TaxID=120398 RepID=A0A485LU69_9STRA|nr:hypothetical protein As57867_024147 [Aphanomyces stellatus]VFU00863.1 Aste57867_24222 [Aphanomyces stellatus]